MDKVALIAKIMTEVKDEKLRDSLLVSIAGEGSPGGGSYKEVVNELERLGINTTAAADYAKSQIGGTVVGGYILGTLFAVGGGYFALSAVASGYPWFALFPGAFCAAGIFAIRNANKLSAVTK